MIADIISLTHTEGAEEETVFKRPIYAGNAILEIKTTKDKDRVRVVTVRTTAFDKATLGEGNGAEVVKVEAVGSSSEWRFRIFVVVFLCLGEGSCVAYSHRLSIHTALTNST